MSRSALKQMIGRQDGTRALINTIATALGEDVSIQDHDGKLLHGEALQTNGERHPVTFAGTGIGWVSGRTHATTVATLLDHLVSREAERKALGAEVLHLYREVNLIYSFSEKLAALLDLERVVQLTLHETRHLIVATDGAIFLCDEETAALRLVAGFGDCLPALNGLTRGVGLIGSVAARGVAEIVDDVTSDPRGLAGATDIHSLICAPLKVGERVIGVIALGSTVAMAYTAGELKLLTTLALQTATAIENARLFERTVVAAQERERMLALQQEMEVSRAKLERELELAARIQADLFPTELLRVPGYDIAARNRSARQCGGDYYDVLPVSNGRGGSRVLLCVADVSGKGLPAALVMSNTQATLRALLQRTTALPELARLASELLYATTPSDKYVTAALVELTPDTGEVRCVNAGHVPGLLLKANGEMVLLESTGMPLGLLPIPLPFGETRLTIASGDCLVLYSDGVIEAQDDADREFGEAGLAAVVRESAAGPADRIVTRAFEAIDRFAGAAPQFDDITMLVLRRL